MWLRIGVSFALTLSLVITAAEEARAQDPLWVPRSQLFSAVLGQQAGAALGQAMNAYALGKARKEDLENIRSQMEKCGNSCSDELKNELRQHEQADVVLDSVIEGVAIKSGAGFGGLDWVKKLLGVEPPKLTADQKAWQDMNSRLNKVRSYCYTISDQLPAEQVKCVTDNPPEEAADIDKLVYNMCLQKFSAEMNMDLTDLSHQLLLI